MTKILLSLLIATTFLSGGCVYKLNVHQGNRVTADDVAKVEIGMTRSQVRFLLGTPMIDDPFHEDRWDYVFYYRDGKTGTEIQRRFEIDFEGDRVSRISEQLN